MSMSTSRSDTIAPLQFCVPCRSILRRLVVCLRLRMLVLIVRVGRIILVFLCVGIWVGMVFVVVVVIDSLSGHAATGCEIVVGNTGYMLVVELGYEFIPLQSGRRVGRGSVVCLFGTRQVSFLSHIAMK